MFINILCFSPQRTQSRNACYDIYLCRLVISHQRNLWIVLKNPLLFYRYTVSQRPPGASFRCIANFNLMACDVSQIQYRISVKPNPAPLPTSSAISPTHTRSRSARRTGHDWSCRYGKNAIRQRKRNYRQTQFLKDKS